jgi:hypothetical protein
LVAACAPVAEVGGLGDGLRVGAMIGAPKFALGAAGAAEVTGGPAFVVGGAGADRAAGALAVAAGGTDKGGAAALKPALVSTIGAIGADSQSRPSNTLPSAIASTAP